MFFSPIIYSQSMEKTTLRSLFLLMIITGSIFAFGACNTGGTVSVSPSGTSSGVNVATNYADGTYTKAGDYNSPSGPESITVTVTVKNNVVQDLSVAGGARSGASQRFMNLFIEGVNAEVVGQKLATVNVGVVNGASLTGIGFNQAIDQIRSVAQK